MKRVKLIVGLLLGLGFYGPAAATLIIIDWTGTVRSTPFPGIVDIGDLITGSFSYDSTSAGYAGGVQAFYQTDHDSSFFVSGFSGTFSNQLISVINRTGDVDQIDSRLNSSVPLSYSGDLISGFSPFSLQVRFTDSTGAVFSDLSLPSVLNPSDFDFVNDFGGASLAISYLRFPIPGFGPDGIGFTMNSFSVSYCDPFPGGGSTGGCFPGPGPFPAPEPGTLALLGLGLAGLGVMRRRRKAA